VPLGPPPGLFSFEAVFTLANAAVYKHSGGPVGRATASLVLKRLRVVSAKDDVCLTDGHILDWRAWMQHHPQRVQIIGAGITRFMWHRFRDAPDPETRGDRCDFIVHRQDGTAVRLHPHSAREDPPVYGFPCMWSSPPTPPGEGDVANSRIVDDPWRVLLAPRHLAMIPPSDYMPLAVAAELLENCGVAPDEIMFFNSRQPDFQWWRFVAALGEGAAEIIGKGISYVAIENSTACPPELQVAPYGGRRFVFWQADKRTMLHVFHMSHNGKTIVGNQD